MINKAKICPSSGIKVNHGSKGYQKNLKLEELITLKREVISMLIEGIFKQAGGEEVIKR